MLFHCLFKWANIFICSFLVFGVFFKGILAWDSLPYIVLNHYTTSANTFCVFPSQSEAYLSPWCFVAINLDDLVLGTRCLHQLDKPELITAGCKHTEVGLVLSKASEALRKSHVGMREVFCTSCKAVLMFITSLVAVSSWAKAVDYKWDQTLNVPDLCFCAGEKSSSNHRDICPAHN